MSITRMGMLGGGADSFVGRIHLLGAQINGIKLVAGTFSSDRDKCRASGELYGVAPERCYASSQEMFAAEAARDDGIEMVAVATPNHLHLQGVIQAISTGVHVISDKPATATLREAQELELALRNSDCRYALTFTYSGYPMVREAKARIAAGEIGAVRKVVVTYMQGTLAMTNTPGWRADPALSGIGGTIADVGTHAFHMLEFVTGLSAVELLSDLSTNVPGRTLDDDCNVLIKLQNGAGAVILASQIAYGDRSSISFHVYGDKGAVSWAVGQADQLRLVSGGETRILMQNDSDLLVPTRIPRGIGNGLVAPFSVLYADFARLCAGDEGGEEGELPGIRAGVRSMKFVELAVKAGASRRGWVKFDDPI